MQNLYEAANYLAVLDAFLRPSSAQKRQGLTKLAAYLKVHPTFVAKTLQGTANFSFEQAIAFTRFAKLSPAEAEFFVDLVAHDRAGDPATREHFAARLRRHRDKRASITERLQTQRDLPIEQQLQYYESWIPQAIHVFCQLPGPHTADSIAQALKIATGTAAAVVGQLVTMGLLQQDNSGYKSTIGFVHTGAGAHMVRRSHSNWRHKTIAHLLERPESKGLHFSGVCSLSEAAALQLRELLLKSLEDSRALIAAAKEETLYVLGVDFFPLF